MTSKESVLSAIDTPMLDEVAEPLAHAVRDAYRTAGAAGRVAKNAAHGVWLGHPLHPVFTDIPLGAWTTALALDMAADGDEGMHRAATFAVGLGVLGAVGAAVTGLTDWSETDGQTRRIGLVHGLANIVATTLAAGSWVARVSGCERRGRGLLCAGYGIAVASAYLGGELVYGRRIGVTHAVTDEPEAYTRIARSADLAEGAMIRARHEDADVLLVRQHGRVCAIAHTCSHLGGPLSEGTLKDGSVVCPWHGSEFRLEDGAVLNGPATQPQPWFDVHEDDGHIEIRART